MGLFDDGIMDKTFAELARTAGPAERLAAGAVLIAQAVANYEQVKKSGNNAGYSVFQAAGELLQQVNRPGPVNETLTPNQAWANVSRRMGEYAREHGYTPEDIAADVAVFEALRAQEGRKDGE